MSYNILISGATGFVGRYFLKALESSPHVISVVVRNSTPVTQGFADKGINVIYTSSPDWKQQVVKSEPEIVFNFAAFLTSLDDEKTVDILLDSNIIFGTHLLNALQNAKVKYFVNTGTFAEYNEAGALEPAYLYGAMKTAFRSILSYYQGILKFKVINVIPYTIYGGFDTKKKLIDHIYDSIHAKEKVKMSPGEQILDFIHIDDVVEFFRRLIDFLPGLNESFTEVHLGTGIGTTPKKIATLVEEVTGKKTNIEWGGIPYRKKDTMYSVAKRNLPGSIINWSPEISIKEGIRNYTGILEK